MIKDGFMYIAVLIFLAAILVNLPRIFKGRIAQNIFIVHKSIIPM